MIRGSDLLLILVAILFPPAAAAFVAGCGCDLLINILLTILGYIPGHIHAFWLIYRRMRAEEQYGHGQSRYVGSGHYQAINASAPYPAQGSHAQYAAPQGAPAQYAAPGPANAPPAGPPSYGAVMSKGT